MAKSTYRETTSFLGLRLPIEMKADIEALASAEDRSVSNWVVRALAKEVDRVKSENK